jgi:L-seryl-tRNA(Ser) seleniumtransferase
MYGGHLPVSNLFMSGELLRALPAIERLLARPAAIELAAQMGRNQVRDLLRQITEELREQIMAGTWAAESEDAPRALLFEIEQRLQRRAQRETKPSLRRVINATGVIIHTNLGRAPLPPAAIEALAEVASGYSNLEYDLERGERGHREVHCQKLLAELLGSEDAVLVNNNAAAVLLVLNTLAQGGEVIVSRGELIEIGGSFRIPEIMERSGARLREVGTTNRTRISDYERAINENTKLILRVHPSNYRIIGFTERPTARQIAELARRAGIPSFEDLGSGCLLDLSRYGVADEPIASESLRAGISIISFSGDKLLGGPQAGLIAGQRQLLERIKKNPLMRALRVDKLTCAAMEATLRLYQRGLATSEIPVIRAITTARDQINQRALKLKEQIERATNGRLRASIQDGYSVIGGGSAPEVKLQTVLIALRGEDMTAESIEARLRANSTPIIARIEQDRVLIDLRTVFEEEERIILDAIAAIAGSAGQ